MRCPLIIISTWLVAASTWAVAAEKPIPQDPAFMRKRSQDWLAWNRATLGDAYAKVGKKDARWDKPAREALDLAARMYSLQVDPFVTPGEIHTSARQAVDAGCDDPLILYVYAQTSIIPNFPGNEEFIRRVLRASDALMASPHSPFRKASALEKATLLKGRQVTLQSPPDQIGVVEAGLDGLFDLLAQSVKVDPRGEFWEARWYDTLKSALAEYRRLNADSKKAFDRFDAKLAEVSGIEPLRLALKGRYFVDWGWEARTDAFAPMVSEKQFQTFEARLTEARATLEAAYKLNPKQPCVAQTMMSVELGIGRGDRDAMELWFERALELNPDDQKACWAKLNWLEPKWYGSEDNKDSLAFGKACVETKNWKSGITLLVAQAISSHGWSLPKDNDESGRYFFQTENWNPIAGVYDEYFKYYPNDSVELSRFAYLAYQANRTRIAQQTFGKVGDNLTTWGGSPYVPLDRLKWVRNYVDERMEEIRKIKATQAPK